MPAKEWTRPRWRALSSLSSRPKGVAKGTGLGLPMVQAFAEQSSGKFVLKSDKGNGTTAELWVPAAPRSAVSVIAEASPAVPTPSRPLTVLVVDDDSLV